MAAAVELGRAATMASVRAAGDDVARPLSALHHATEPPRKRWTCMQMKSLDLVLSARRMCTAVERVRRELSRTVRHARWVQGVASPGWTDRVAGASLPLLGPL